jgi:hypothetical protein
MLISTKLYSDINLCDLLWIVKTAYNVWHFNVHSSYLKLKTWTMYDDQKSIDKLQSR